MRTKIITVTAINLLTAVNDIILTNRKKNKSARIVLPSLRQRALQVLNENSVMPIVESEETPDIPFTR